MNRRSGTIIAIAAGLILVAVAAVAQDADYERATFAGGCFWCMEKPYDLLEGVISTTSGFSGGHVEDPSYREVSQGGTGHLEVVQVVYDPDVVSYEELLYVYWRNVDPFDGQGQFCDRGHTYTPAIFVSSDEQRTLAERSAEVVRRELGRRPAVEILDFQAFYGAEEYHQDYYDKNPLRYAYYRGSCGRDRRLEAVWGDEAGGHAPEPWL